MIQFGIETEYGITRDGAEDLDVVAESIALVRATVAPGVRMKWDYAPEDPHADVRGFKVDELRQDFDEARYYAADARRELSFAEIKSDVALANGARFYNDHAHPEYCTPECSTVEEVVIHDRAGERIVMDAAARLSAERGTTVRIYKNNTDFRGHSYGCHENYLLPRDLPWERLVSGIEAFLVTRQIYCGAGKFGVEAEDRFVGPAFQLSQRADFFTVLQSVDTMQRRPLINTRDEPHAQPEKWRRFHVIVGDANMSPFATRLKLGTLALVLELLVRRPEVNLPRIAAPLETLRAVSRDSDWKWKLTLDSREATTAISVQRRYLEKVREVCDLTPPDRKWVVEKWETVLSDLERDPLCCRNRLDWVAKHALIQEFATAEGVDADDPWLRSLDLEYHRLDRDEGLYFGLERAGLMQDVPDELQERNAKDSPPETTRAAIRGRCVEKFGHRVRAVQWDHVVLAGERYDIKVSLLDLFAPGEVARYRDALERAATPDEFRKLLDGHVDDKTD
jgi:proteasome accessory factor PafA2